jgi:hypothetical protein
MVCIPALWLVACFLVLYELAGRVGGAFIVGMGVKRLLRATRCREFALS